MKKEKITVMKTDEESNVASKKVLEKVGFIPTSERGEEGPVFVCRKTN